MKCIIQVPCYNEEQTIGMTLSQLPRSLPGVDSVEWLVIDDGCSDGTVEAARRAGVDHVISHPRNQGLAKAFMTGLETCLALGADLIVNTDADNQYRADDLPELIRPVLEGRAEMVVGARSIDAIEDFSRLKKWFQKLGSWVVRVASGTDVPDAPSGFRAITRKAALQLNVFNNYTYTLETIIQAGQKGIPVTWVPVRTNRKLRSPRLFKTMGHYILKSIVTIVRIFVVYKPFKFFVLIGLALGLAGVLIGLRFLYYYAIAGGAGHVQSLILASILLGMGFQTLILAFVADLLSVNRRLLEEIQVHSRSRRMNSSARGERE